MFNLIKDHRSFWLKIISHVDQLFDLTKYHWSYLKFNSSHNLNLLIMKSPLLNPPHWGLSNNTRMQSEAPPHWEISMCQTKENKESTHTWSHLDTPYLMKLEAKSWWNPPLWKAVWQSSFPLKGNLAHHVGGLPPDFMQHYGPPFGQCN
jgi:hypothetical protein